MLELPTLPEVDGLLPPEDFWRVWEAWLGGVGYGLVYLPWEEGAPRGYAILRVKFEGRREACESHAILCFDGVPVWDPSGAELTAGIRGTPVGWTLVYPLDPLHRLPPEELRALGDGLKALREGRTKPIEEIRKGRES